VVEVVKETTSRAPVSGDDEAFSRFVVPEIPGLFRMARSLTHDAHDAEDLVQDTLVRAYRAIGRFDGGHPRAWLFTILRRTHINRNRARRAEVFDDPHAVESIPERHESDPALRAEQVAFRQVVIEAMTRLTPTMRQVVELVDIESLSYAEAAAHLGVPIGTVMSRLHRGRRHIREELITSGLVTRKVGRS
jgi:RNA polymerase sigma-70 factor, ECF subfamily